MKNNKAVGPDNVPIELFKVLNDSNLEKIAEMYDKWWDTEAIPESATRAKVARIYKKGSPSKIANYRPISLLLLLFLK